MGGILSSKIRMLIISMLQHARLDTRCRLGSPTTPEASYVCRYIDTYDTHSSSGRRIREPIGSTDPCMRRSLDSAGSRQQAGLLHKQRRSAVRAVRIQSHTDRTGRVSVRRAGASRGALRPLPKPSRKRGEALAVGEPRGLLLLTGMRVRPGRVAVRNNQLRTHPCAVVGLAGGADVTRPSSARGKAGRRWTGPTAVHVDPHERTTPGGLERPHCSPFA